MCRASVRTGIMMIPPPMPSREPRSPANTEASRAHSTKLSGVMPGNPSMTVRLRAHSSLILAALAMLNRGGIAQSSGAPGDPVLSDPVALDTVYPPRTEELAFQSQGVRLNGFLYLAQGKGPHSTVILLHGFPGNERNLDLAQALRRSGMNVLYFSYRGAWGSGGVFSFAHTLEDVASAIRYLRSDSSVRAFRVDPKRVMLVGHSMGGWLALMGAAADSTVTCAAALDFWNVGADGRAMP